MQHIGIRHGGARDIAKSFITNMNLQVIADPRGEGRRVSERHS